MFNVLYLTLQSLTSFNRRSAGMIPRVGWCENGLGTWVWEDLGCRGEMVARTREIRKNSGFESRCECHSFFFFFFFFHFLSFFFFFFFFFFVCVLHKTLFANYDSACIVKFTSNLRQIKPQVFL